jgi:hypothetical protein
MKKAVKEVVKTVKAVKVELNKVDRRTFNPGRPKSEAAQQQEEFVYKLTQGQTFTVEGLSGEFSLGLKKSLYKDDVIVGSLLNTYPSKLKFETTTLIGNTVDYVIKYKDIVLK